MSFEKIKGLVSPTADVYKGIRGSLQQKGCILALLD